MFHLKKYLIGRLRRWDIRTSNRVGRFLANSGRVAERIQSAYGRDADVLFPPVNTEFFTPARAASESFALCVGALVPYKRFERAISWANHARFPLKIIGGGPEEKRLRAMASASVEFEKDLTRHELRERYRHCAFFLQPGEEDFGMASVEAQACGRPVVALNRGGIRDVLSSAELGALYEEDSMAGMEAAVDTLRRVGFNAEGARQNAGRFSRERFRSGFSDFLREMMNA